MDIESKSSVHNLNVCEEKQNCDVRNVKITTIKPLDYLENSKMLRLMKRQNI